jgi:hypothetical protein
MSCLVRRNSQNTITNVLTPQGYESKAFKAVYSIPYIGGTETALNVFSNIYSKTVMDMYNDLDSESPLLYTETKEPKIVLRDNKGSYHSGIESIIKSNNEGRIEIGVVNPKDSSFIKFGEFNTSGSSMAQTITNGIKQGLIKPDMVLGDDGVLRLEGNGAYVEDRFMSMSLFKDDFQIDLGIGLNVDNQGLGEIKPITDSIVVKLEDGTTKVISYSDIKNNNVEDSTRLHYISKNPLSIKVNLSENKNDVKKSIVPTEVLMNKALNLFNKLGFSVMTMSKYRENYENRHSEDLDVKSLIDLGSKVVAISEDDFNGNDITEELLHLLIEAYSENESIVDALSEVENTTEYTEWAEAYRSKYKDMYSGVELEDHIRKEILGKIIANRIVDSTIKLESNSVFRKIWDKVSEWLKSIFHPFKKTAIDILSKEIENSITSEDFQKFDFKKIHNGVYYSLVNDLKAFNNGLSNIANDLNSFARLHKVDGRSLNDAKLKKMSNNIDIASTLNNVSEVYTAILHNASSLRKAVEDNTFSGLDFARSNSLLEMVNDANSFFKEQIANLRTHKESSAYFKNIADLIKTINNVKIEVENLHSDLDSRSSEVFESIIDNLVESSSLNTEEVRAEFERLLTKDLKDTSVIAKWFGIPSESSNLLVSLFAKVRYKQDFLINARTQEEQSGFLDEAIENGYTDLSIQKGLLEVDDKGDYTGYQESAVKMWLWDKNKEDKKADIISDLTGKPKSEVLSEMKSSNVETILDNNFDLLDEFKKRFDVWHKENSENKYLDSYLEQKESEFNLVDASESTKEMHQGLFNKVAEILSKYKDSNGRIDESKISKSDMHILEKSRAGIRSRMSLLNGEGKFHEGLTMASAKDILSNKHLFDKVPMFSATKDAEFRDKLMQLLRDNPDMMIAIPEVDVDTLSIEARYALDINNLNLSKRVQFKEKGNITVNSNSDFINKIKEYRNNNDKEGLASFLKSTNAVSINDEESDVEFFASNAQLFKGLLDEVENTEDKQKLKQLIDSFELNQQQNKLLLKANRSASDYQNILAGNITIAERRVFNERKDSIDRQRKEIVFLFKKNGINVNETIDVKSNSSNQTLTTNNAFESEFEASGETSRVSFAMTVMSPSAMNSVSNFRQNLLNALTFVGYPQSKEELRIDDLLEKRFGLEYTSLKDKVKNAYDLSEKGLISDSDLQAVKDEIYEEVSMLYATLKLPAYFQRYNNEYIDNFYKEVKDKGRFDKVIDALVDNNGVYDSKIVIQPNFAWADVEYAGEKLNPHYKEFLGYSQPKIYHNGDMNRPTEYFNQNWFTKSGVTKDEYKNAKDFTDIDTSNKTTVFKYQNFIYRMRLLSDNRYGNSGNKLSSIQVSKTGYQKLKSNLKNIKSTIRDTYKDAFYDRLDDMIHGDEYGGGNFSSTFKVIPVFFRRKLDDSNSVMEETLTAQFMDLNKSIEYEVRSELASTYKAILSKAQNSKFKTTGLHLKKTNSFKNGEESTTFSMLKEMMDDTLYGVKQSSRWEFEMFGKTIDFTKVLMSLRKISVFNNLAWNPMIALTSRASALTQEMQSYWSGGYYSKASINEVGVISPSKELGNMMLNYGYINDKSYGNALLEYLGIKNASHRLRESSATRVGRFLRDSPMMLDETMSLPVRLRVAMTMMADYRMVSSKDANGNDVFKVIHWSQFKTKMASEGVVDKDKVNDEWAKLKSMRELSENKNGKLVPTESFLENMTKRDFENIFEGISARVQQQISHIEAMIPEGDRINAQRDAFLNMFMQHKSWLPIVLTQQFKKEGYNSFTGRFEEGYVVTGGKILSALIKSGYKMDMSIFKDFIENRTDFQKANTKRLIIAGGTYAGILTIIAALFGVIGGDDDNDEDSWAKTFSQIIALRTLSEFKSSSPIGVTTTVRDIVKDPFTALSTYDASIKAVGSVFNYNSDDYISDVREKIAKATFLRRYTQLSNLEDYKSNWLFMNNHIFFDYEKKAWGGAKDD